MTDFMQREVTGKMLWFQVDSFHDGIVSFPSQYFSKAEAQAQYPDLKVTEVEGYGARMSAPGYLDCTEWAVFDTPEKANEYLDEIA